MGFSNKTQVDSGLDSDGKKWVIAGISLKTTLKPISTKSRFKSGEDDEQEESRSTTPTSKEARIPAKLPCPPAPVKRRPPLKCHYNGGREFFCTPPDLETIFKRHVEKAN